MIDSLHIDTKVHYIGLGLATYLLKKTGEATATHSPIAGASEDIEVSHCRDTNVSPNPGIDQGT